MGDFYGTGIEIWAGFGQNGRLYINTAPPPHFWTFRHLWYSISFGQFEGQIEFPIIKVKCVTAFGANSRPLRKSILETLATSEFQEQIFYQINSYLSDMISREQKTVLWSYVSHYIFPLLQNPEHLMFQTKLKVSKSQKHFFLKLHCPKNERNIRQNSAL